MFFLIIGDGPIYSLPLYCRVIPTSASVTATEYNIVSNQKLNFNIKTYNLIVGKTFYLMSLAK